MVEQVDVLAPADQEGTKAVVLRWCRAPGERIEKDEPLLELETDKVTVEVSAPVSGVLDAIFKQVNDAVEPGEPLGRIRAGEPAVAAASAASTAMSAALSPAVRRLLAENNLSAQGIAGTGRDGRITAEDVLRHVERAGGTPPSGRASAIAAAQAPRTGTLVPHTPMRRRIAEHMARSVAVAPHVTTVFEADLTRIIAHRKRFAESYQARGGHLTLTAYFVAAAVAGLQAVPQINSSFHTEHLELHGDCNIGVGTALGNEGLIVPVIHHAQTLDLFGIAQQLGTLVAAARAGTLGAASVRGGTFTISNHGVSGSLLAAPIIINQPQVAILGVGKVQRRVVVEEIDGEDVQRVRSMCYLTLTIDHRAVDAFQANAFLSKVVETLERWPLE